jgi:hypothetical protein
MNIEITSINRRTILTKYQHLYDGVKNHKESADRDFL